MNMQPANGDHFLAVKNRTTELQSLIFSTESRIQSKRQAYIEKKQIAKRRKIYLAEYDLLYPSAPVDGDFVEINAEISALELEISALELEISQLTPLQSIQKWSRRFRRRMAIESLEQSKAQSIANHHNGREQLSQQLTDEQFITLYPEPLETVYAADKLVIDNARIEANQLQAFMKSGPQPNPGLYDADLLVGTAVSLL